MLKRFIAIWKMFIVQKHCTEIKIHHIHSLSPVSLQQCNFQAGNAGKPLSQSSQKLLKGTLCPSDLGFQTSQVFACIRITYIENNSNSRKEHKIHFGTS